MVVGEIGATSRSVKNCTLSRDALERTGNIANGPKALDGVVCSPDVVAGQGDMLPAEWGDVGNELVGNLPPLLPQMPHGAVEIDRIPMDDRGRNEAQA